MPRGNDTEHAAAFDQAAMAQYGIHANAEDMIKAHRASVDPALTKASLLQPDADATEEARGDLAGVRKKLGLDKDAVVLDATVRGNALLAVVENEAGVAEKVVGGWNDDYVPPKLGPAEELARAEAARDRQVQEEIAQLKAEQDQKIADLRAEMEEKLADQIEKIQGKADKELEKTEKEIQKEQGSGSSSSKGSGSGGSKSGSGGSKGSGSKSSGSKSSGSADTSATGSGPAGAGGSTRSPEEKKSETKQD